MATTLSANPWLPIPCMVITPHRSLQFFLNRDLKLWCKRSSEGSRGQFLIPKMDAYWIFREKLIALSWWKEMQFFFSTHFVLQTVTGWVCDLHETEACSLSFIRFFTIWIWKCHLRVRALNFTPSKENQSPVRWQSRSFRQRRLHKPC
jgi:hypothetical protein